MSSFQVTDPFFIPFFWVCVEIRDDCYLVPNSFVSCSYGSGEGVSRIVGRSFGKWQIVVVDIIATIPTTIAVYGYSFLQHVQLVWRPHVAERAIKHDQGNNTWKYCLLVIIAILIVNLLCDCYYRRQRHLAQIGTGAVLYYCLSDKLSEFEWLTSSLASLLLVIQR